MLVVRTLLVVVWMGALAGCSAGGSGGNPATGGGAHASAGAAGTSGGSGGVGNGGSAGTSSAGVAGLSAAGGSTLPPLGDSAAEACIAYAVASCERRDFCASGNTNGCLGVTWQCPDLVSSAGSTRTPAGLKACAESYKTYSCDLINAGTLPPCVTPGTRKRGEACLYPSQCESLDCEFHGDCGLCAVEAADGEDCSAPDVGCKDKSTCESGKCVHYGSTPTPGKSLGDACKMGDYCKDGVCDGTTCKPLPALGESCMQTYNCANDGTCDTKGFLCRKLPATGEPCLLDISGDYRCAEGLLCHTTVDTTPDDPGLCGPIPALGEPCIVPPKTTFTIATGCGENKRCDRSVTPAVCATIGTPGTKCASVADCAQGLYCMCPDGSRTCPSLCSNLRFGGQSCDLTGNTCHPAFSCVAGQCVPRENQGSFEATCKPAP